MLSVEDFRFFCTLADSVSLAAAARALDVSPPAVSQRLQQLERRLQVRLVDRSTRRFSLTAEGVLLAERGRAVLGEVEAIAEALAERQGIVSGCLRVVAPFGFGRRFVAPVVGAFRSRNPAVNVELILSDSPGRLTADAWDVIVHIGDLKDSAFVAQKIAPNTRVTCAAPAYLERQGTPASPSDLAAHACIALRENDEDATLWRFSSPNGAVTAVRVDAALASNDGEVTHRWALAGLGILNRSEWDVADDLARGDLVRILPDWHLPVADIVALVGARAGKAARTRSFLEMLRTDLARPAWRTKPAASVHLREPQN